MFSFPNVKNLSNKRERTKGIFLFLSKEYRRKGVFSCGVIGVATPLLLDSLELYYIGLQKCDAPGAPGAPKIAGTFLSTGGSAGKFGGSAGNSGGSAGKFPGWEFFSGGSCHQKTASCCRKAGFCCRKTGTDAVVGAYRICPSAFIPCAAKICIICGICGKIARTRYRIWVRQVRQVRRIFVSPIV